MKFLPLTTVGGRGRVEQEFVKLVRQKREIEAPRRPRIHRMRICGRRGDARRKGEKEDAVVLIKGFVLLWAAVYSGMGGKGKRLGVA